MKVLFTASEMTPLAKVGGLGDVIGSLPKALCELGVEASIIIPRYKQIPLKGLKKITQIDRGTYVYKKTLKGVPIYLIDNKRYLSGGSIYFEKTAFVGGKKEIDRFVFFSKSVMTLLKKEVLKADIVHAHDWHTGELVSLISKLGKKRVQSGLPKVMFTIHNLANQGVWKGKNLMREGIRNADLVSTVSPTYAKEILTEQFGRGLHKPLKRRAKEKKLIGILNGIDNDFWNPHADKFLKQKYSAKSIGKKRVNKLALVKKYKLRSNTAPLFGLVARLTDQKGIDFVVGAAPALIEKYNAQFIFLGSGAEQYEAALLRLQKQFPQHVSVTIGFSEAFAHQIYAGSDFFLMPSRFEPSGLGQMISMRYGTIPVVRKTGGLNDSVIHLRTGFVFSRSSSQSLKESLELAAHYYTKKPKQFRAIRSRCLKKDFAFSQSAKSYKAAYRKLFADNLSSPS